MTCVAPAAVAATGNYRDATSHPGPHSIPGGNRGSSGGRAKSVEGREGVSIRECVVNAIKHGNKHDASKRVFVAFETTVDAVPELMIRVRDEGEGFDPSALMPAA